MEKEISFILGAFCVDVGHRIDKNAANTNMTVATGFNHRGGVADSRI